MCWLSVCLRSRAKVCLLTTTWLRVRSLRLRRRSVVQLCSVGLPELLENYEFEYDDPNEKAIKATCIVCNKHYKKFQAQFKGTVVQDVVNYGENGTTYLLKPNLERHLSSEGHRKCKEFETGESTSKKQKTITQAFGGAFELAKKTLCNILCIVHCASNWNCSLSKMDSHNWFSQNPWMDSVDSRQNHLRESK